MKIAKRYYLMAALAVLLIPTLAPAQGQQQVMHRYEMEYRTTAELIDRVQNKIKSSGIDKGSELLDLANSLQSQAREMGMVQQQFVVGITLTMNAREKAKLALTVNQQAKENEGLVYRQLEKTERLLERISGSMPANVGPKIETLYNNAVENQRQAWEFYRNNQLRPALKLSRQVENRLTRMQKLMSKVQGNFDQNRIRIEQLQQKMERVESAVGDCQNREALDLLEAVKNRMANMNGNPAHQPDDNQLGSMNQQLNRVLDLCQGRSIQREQLDGLAADLAVAGESIRNSGNENAIRLFTEAQKHWEKANYYFNSGDLESCAANIKAGQLSLIKAKKLIGL